MNALFHSALIITALLAPAIATAAGNAPKAGDKAAASVRAPRPLVVVAPRTSVHSDTVLLRDIARIESSSRSSDTLSGKLSNVIVSESPLINHQRSINGEDILGKIVAAGISTHEFGYSIPRKVLLERPGRALQKGEVLAAFADYLQSSAKKKGDVKLKGIHWSSTQMIDKGKVSFEFQKLGEARNGKLPLRVEVLVNGKKSTQFLASASLDIWRTVPIPKHHLARGMLIRPEDIALQKVNLSRQSKSIIESLDQIVGKRAKASIQAGFPIQEGNVYIPPVVARGAKVTIHYRAGSIQATATGVSLEDGMKREMVQVQNATSKKIVKAVVVVPHTVLVEAR